MKAICRLIIWQLLFAGMLSAEPLNFLLGDITFTRPKDWRFVLLDEKLSHAQVRFDIYRKEVQTSTYVNGYFAAQSVTQIRDGWKNAFQPLEKYNEETVKVGKHSVTYMTASGVYRSSNGKRFAGKRLIGVIIPREKHSIAFRIFGRVDEPDDFMKDVRKMLEEALKEGG